MFNFLKNMLGNASNQEIAEAAKDGALLVDVRTPGEFSTGSVKGAVNIPLDQLANQTGKFQNKNHIIVFCRSGNRSSQAKAFLTKNGFSNVINGGSWTNVQGIIEA